MKEINCKYLGVANKVYHFIDNNGKKYFFSKIRSDLISQFSLHDPSSINGNFLVRFFVYDTGYNDIFIISDLETTIPKNG